MERLSDRHGDGPSLRVYTVCDESRYLIVRNVPALGCVDELVQLFASYGPVEEYRLLDEEDAEEFTDVYWIKFVNISNARFAKRKLDEYKFLGNLLQVTYAPHYESFSDTRDKLEERRKTVLNRISASKSKETKASKEQCNSTKDPLLSHLPPMNAIGQFPKFPLEKLPMNYLGSDAVAADSFKNAIQSSPVSNTLCNSSPNMGEKYFPSSSMK
ncbi:hypothetical protein O6H91_Y013600 [Diphasiastrum complanatum]|nr:hypothetical protein O6H91_Y013600 [Diphasiastrum complanatum]